MNAIKIQLFGVLQEYVPAGRLVIPLHGITTVTTLKALIMTHLVQEGTHVPERNLVCAAVVATNTEILQADEVVNEYQELALLPPVCGG